MSAVAAWVERIAAWTRPAAIDWWDGDAARCRELDDALVRAGKLSRLDAASHPDCYLHRGAPNDAARADEQTFVVASSRAEVGPTNRWMLPEVADAEVWPLFARAMKGRTMYVVPYVLGPAGSPRARVGVQVTDSPLVVAGLRRVARTGAVALELLGGGDHFVRGVHAIADASPARRFILHFPRERTIWSVGSEYGGNALLSKKCHGLRIASSDARREGWFAEHMALFGVTSPAGRTHFVAAALASCRWRTDVAMMSPALPGWSIETLGDDIAWLHVDERGRLCATNPEAGMFGLATGTHPSRTPNAMAMIAGDAIFSNVALDDRGAPYWDGLPLAPERSVVDWRGQPWMPGRLLPAAHPNARYVVPATRCPTVGSAFESPPGVPLSAVIFGGRRTKLAPLIHEARSFEHGVYVGATMVAEGPPTASGAPGEAHRNAMGMQPFCTYDMAEYFQRWIDLGRSLRAPPRIFHLNLARTADRGEKLWPGGGHDVHWLRWIVERVEGSASARETPIGLVPEAGAFDAAPPAVSRAFDALFAVDADAWRDEMVANAAFLRQFGEQLPHELRSQHREIARTLGASGEP